MKQAFPLSWPPAYKRTITRVSSKFGLTPEKAQDFLRNEIKLMGAVDLIVSSNVMTRKDGYVYGDMSSTKLDDPGVAIYFNYKKKAIVMCADKYLTPIENLIALAKGIEALRGMERWGVSEFMERAFTGFIQIEGPKEKEWYDVLEVKEDCSADVIKANWRRLCKDWHPDKQKGNSDKFIEINRAYDKAKTLKSFT